MEKEILGKYMKAGRICAEIKQEVLSAAKPGMKLLELADMIEKSIAEKGGKPAFPVNISLNDIAAHYTPSRNDERAIQPADLVKIDVGVHVDGYIGDMAFTYCSEKNTLVDCARKCLRNAIKAIMPGVTVSEISSAIQETANREGLGLITNLTGHTLGQYQFHGEPSIPNVINDSSYSFKDGDVIALEPFTARTNGFVKESGVTEIYRYLFSRPVRLTEARKILAMARDDYHSLPFAKRWLYEKISPVKVSLALRQLEAMGALQTFPILREIEGKPIAQAEHTIIVADTPIVTTRLE